MTIIKVINCKNLVIKPMPKNIPERKYFFLIKKYIATKMKAVDIIPASIIVEKKKKVGVSASNKAASKAVFLSNISLAIKNVINKLPVENNKDNNFPNKTISRSSFHKNPNIKGHINGLDASHSPAFPKE